MIILCQSSLFVYVHLNLIIFIYLCIDLLWFLIIPGYVCLISFIQFATLLTFFPRSGDTKAGGKVSTILAHHKSIPYIRGLFITHHDLVLTIFFTGLGLLLMGMLGASPPVMQSGYLPHALCLSLVSSLCLMEGLRSLLSPSLFNGSFHCIMHFFVACCIWLRHCNLFQQYCLHNMSSNCPTDFFI